MPAQGATPRGVCPPAPRLAHSVAPCLLGPRCLQVGSPDDSYCGGRWQYTEDPEGCRLPAPRSKATARASPRSLSGPQELLTLDLGPRVREGPVLFRFCGLVSNRVEKNKVEKITITMKLNQIRPVTHLWSRKNRKQKQAGSREESGARRRRRDPEGRLPGSHH